MRGRIMLKTKLNRNFRLQSDKLEYKLNKAIREKSIIRVNGNNYYKTHGLDGFYELINDLGRMILVIRVGKKRKAFLHDISDENNIRKVDVDSICIDNEEVLK